MSSSSQLQQCYNLHTLPEAKSYHCWYGLGWCQTGSNSEIRNPSNDKKLRHRA